MRIGGILHGINAIVHALSGDLVGAAKEGGRAIASIALGSLVGECADKVDLADKISSLIP